MTDAIESSAPQERQFHQYTSNRIPWYVRLVWLGFWIFTVYYAVQYLLPALKVELISPP